MNILTVFTSLAGVITLFVLLLNEFKKATPPISYHLHKDKQSMILFLKFGRLETRPYQIKKLTAGGLKAPRIIGYKINGIDTLIQNKKIKLDLTINPKFNNIEDVPILKLQLEKTELPFLYVSNTKILLGQDLLTLKYQ